MKKFLKIIGWIFTFIAITALIFIISAIRLKKISQRNLIQKYNSVAVEEIFEDRNTLQEENTMVLLNENEPVKVTQKVNDWRLILVNFENELPENYEIELANIDSQRQFDKRAINEINQMLKDAKNARIGNLWAQSTFRSVERQDEIYNKKVNEYIKAGKTQEEAEMLTNRFINKTNTSEHNLGLAVDFNYINMDFEKTKAFVWLCENAQNYGFVLRYPKDKEEITRVAYEPWHWRFVGEEHAKRMNELGFCLEEYIEFLENGG